MCVCRWAHLLHYFETTAPLRDLRTPNWKALVSPAILPLTAGHCCCCAAALLGRGLCVVISGGVRLPLALRACVRACVRVFGRVLSESDGADSGVHRERVSGLTRCREGSAES